MPPDSESSARPRRVTLQDVAQRLGVSRATVSRALNEVEDPFISEATRQRVRATAQELGYRPNHAARSLQNGRTGLLALWLYPVHGQAAYHAAIAREMGKAAAAHGYPMIVDPIRPHGDVRHFDRWNVDGIVAHEAAPVLNGAPRPPVPIVTTGVFSLIPDVDRVEIDLLDGARAAMAHLIEGGRRRIVYVTDDLDVRSEDARFVAYRDAMEGAGLEPRYLDVPSSRAGARETVRAFTEAYGAPDALFCHNDDFAVGAYRGLCDLGVRVPDDVALVGCDGIEEMEYLEVPITTIAQPLGAMCEAAFRMLTSRMQEPDLPPRYEHLAARLVIRASTGG